MIHTDKLSHFGFQLFFRVTKTFVFRYLSSQFTISRSMFGKTEMTVTMRTICRTIRFGLLTPISAEISAISVAPAGVTISMPSRRLIPHVFEINVPVINALII